LRSAAGRASPVVGQRNGSDVEHDRHRAVVDELQRHAGAEHASPHFDGYIRVSDTKGRSRERFLSPDIQRDTIARIARAKGVKLNEPIVEELDVSGGKRIEDCEFECGT
jgi:hypothetical protein